MKSQDNNNTTTQLVRECTVIQKKHFIDDDN